MASCRRCRGAVGQLAGWSAWDPGELPAQKSLLQCSSSRYEADDHTGAGKGWRLAALLLFGRCHGERTWVAHVVQVIAIQPSERWTWEMRNASMWPLKGVGDGGYVPCITLTGSGVRRAQARLADRRGEHRPEPVLSEPHRLRLEIPR
jgi:hypothetical protein